MKRPELPAMGRFDAAMENYNKAEETLERAKNEIVNAIYEVAAEANSLNSDPMGAMNYLYWTALEIPSTTIIEAFVDRSRPHLIPGQIKLLKKQIKPLPSEFPCDRCSRAMPITSRSKVAEYKSALRKEYPRWAEGYRLLCNDCKEAVMNARHKKYAAQDRARKEKIRLLQSMTYDEYLATPEFRATAEYYLDEVDRTCQVCGSSGVSLTVHSRKKKYRGQEPHNNLVATCTDCEDLLLREGKLFSQ